MHCKVYLQACMRAPSTETVVAAGAGHSSNQSREAATEKAEAQRAEQTKAEIWHRGQTCVASAGASALLAEMELRAMCVARCLRASMLACVLAAKSSFNTRTSCVVWANTVATATAILVTGVGAQLVRWPKHQLFGSSSAHVLQKDLPCPVCTFEGNRTTSGFFRSSCGFPPHSSLQRHSFQLFSHTSLHLVLMWSTAQHQPVSDTHGGLSRPSPFHNMLRPRCPPPGSTPWSNGCSTAAWNRRCPNGRRLQASRRSQHRP